MKILMSLLLMISINSFGKDTKDMRLVHESVKRINDLLGYFSTDIEPILERYKTSDHIILNRIESDKINDFWTQLIDHRIVLHTLYNHYKDDGKTFQGSLIKYSSNLQLKLSAAVLSKALWYNKGARKKLNETNKEQIPRGSFMNFENELFRDFNNRIINLNEQLPTYFPVYELEIDFKNLVGFSRSPGTRIEMELEGINNSSTDRFISYRKFVTELKNVREVSKRFFRYKFKTIFYNFMKKISTWLGDTKVNKRNPDYYNGQTLIDIKMAKMMEEKVKPGDIMISRTNWFLSNAFLPGFWMHSFIYLGSKEKLINYFDTVEVKNYFKARCFKEEIECNNISTYLRRSRGTAMAWKRYIRKDKYGFNNVLIEATSEGVHFSSIRHTFLNDYLAAMRPKLSKLAKAKAIVQSLLSYGLEYDFDFDYTTDDRLVCSELVGKAYEKNPLKNGLGFNYDINKGKYLTVTMGRLALPVVNFVHKIYDENIMKMRDSELSFVAFLRGDKKLNSSRFTSESMFYQSRDWKKWDFMNKDGAPGNRGNQSRHRRGRQDLIN